MLQCAGMSPSHSTTESFLMDRGRVTARVMSSAFLLKQLDEPLLSGHETIDLRRWVEEFSDGSLLLDRNR